MAELFQLLFWPKRIGNALHLVVVAIMWMTTVSIALALALSPFIAGRG